MSRHQSRDNTLGNLGRLSQRRRRVVVQLANRSRLENQLKRPTRQPRLTASETETSVIEETTVKQPAEAAPGTKSEPWALLNEFRNKILEPDRIRWVFLGDELTAFRHEGDPSPSYCDFFVERLQWEVGRDQDNYVNAGLPGATIALLRYEYLRSYASFRPNVVSIYPGWRDCASTEQSVDFFRDHLARFVDEVQSRGGLVILHTPYRSPRTGELWGCPIQSYAMAIRQVASDRGAILVDHWRFWSEEAHEPLTFDWLDADGRFPNTKGQRVMAYTMLTELDLFDRDSTTCKLCEASTYATSSPETPASSAEIPSTEPTSRDQQTPTGDPARTAS